MRQRRFIQCDVFTSTPTKGNGLAVVLDGDDLSSEQMQAFAAWTNLAETTFLLPPATAGADYTLRIFTPSVEMPFAGHPTLGSCAAWLHAGSQPRTPGLVRQQCGVGIVEIDVASAVPAFAAPRTTVAPLAPDKLHAITSALGLSHDRILRTAQLANGPVWQVLELTSAADVLALDSAKLSYPEFDGVGVIGAHPPGAEYQYETRHLAPSSGMSEDPITGSLNAAIAQWMYGAGHWHGPIVVAQGACMGREGRVFIRKDEQSGTVWIGGNTCILIEGTLIL